MRNYNLKLKIFVFLLSILGYGFGGTDISPEKKKLTYSEIWTWQDYSKNHEQLDLKYFKNGVLTKDSVLWQKTGQVKNEAINEFVLSQDIKSIIMVNSDIDFLSLMNIDVQKNLNIWMCNLNGPVWLGNFRSFKPLYFSGTIFKGPIICVDSILFENEVHFYSAKFQDNTNFSNIEFGNLVDFAKSEFLQNVSFYKIDFKNVVNFSISSFKDRVLFTDVLFQKKCNFSGASFEQEPHFTRTTFKYTVNLQSTYFKLGIDLRRTNFDSVNTILLEDINFPMGSFIFHWDQFKAKNFPRIKIVSYSENNIDDYNRIEAIYINLKDNFIVLNDKKSAADVMYELEWYKEIILDQFSQKIYGFFLGYGYKPYKFILYLMLPFVFLFSIVWYFWYYGIVANILNKNIDKELDLQPNYKIKYPIMNIKLFNNINIWFYNHAQLKPQINILAKIWHCLFFSASVLLGIRFKKEWINVYKINTPGRDEFGTKSFFWILSIEWILGFVLYVVFAVFMLKLFNFNF